MLCVRSSDENALLVFNIIGANASGLSAGRAMTMTRHSEALRVAEPSAEAPPPGLRQSPEMFPWSKEWALWYGCVSLMAGPGSGPAAGMIIHHIVAAAAAAVAIIWLGGRGRGWGVLLLC